MEYNSRRKFIKEAALIGFATCITSPVRAFASISDDSTKRILLKDGAVFLFQGDSITDGNWGRNGDPNHVMGHGYAFSIASRIGADYPEKKFHFFNRGMSGNKVIDLEKRWKADTIDLKPDILSILIGVNDSASIVTDWEPEVSIERFESIYDLLLKQTLEAFPEILFVLGEPFIARGSRTIDNWDVYVEDIKQRQAVVRRLANKYNAVFVGYQNVFELAFKKAPVDYWIWDGIHPTVAGHELMTREWLKQVETRSYNIK